MSFPFSDYSGTFPAVSSLAWIAKGRIKLVLSGLTTEQNLG
jgi:hypothetical protein